MTQRKLRILTVAPAAEPRPELPPFVPLGNGTFFVGDADEEAVGRLMAAALEMQRDAQLAREPSSRIDFEDEDAAAAAFRATLLGFAGRRAPVAMVEAGRLLRAHGDAARRALFFAADDALGAPRARLDELLARAGVEPGGILT